MSDDVLLEEAAEQQEKEYEEVSEWRLNNSYIQYKTYDNDEWKDYKSVGDFPIEDSSKFRDKDLRQINDSVENAIKDGKFELKYSGSVDSDLVLEGDREVLYVPFNNELEPKIVREVVSSDGEFVAGDIKKQTENVYNALKSKELLIDSYFETVYTVGERKSILSKDIIDSGLVTAFTSIFILVNWYVSGFLPLDLEPTSPIIITISLIFVLWLVITGVVLYIFPSALKEFILGVYDGVKNRGKIQSYDEEFDFESDDW